MSYLSNNPNLRDSIEELHAVAANIGEIFFIPTLDPHNIPDNFLGFLEDLDDFNIETLEKQYEGFQQIADSYAKCNRRDRNDFACEFISELHQKCEFPMLVEIQLCQTIYSVSLDKEQQPCGFGGVWNSHCSNWILVENWEKAIEMGIVLGKKNLLDHHNTESA